MSSREGSTSAQQNWENFHNTLKTIPDLKCDPMILPHFRILQYLSSKCLSLVHQLSFS